MSEFCGFWQEQLTGIRDSEFSGPGKSNCRMIDFSDRGKTAICTALQKAVLQTITDLPTGWFSEWDDIRGRRSCGPCAPGAKYCVASWQIHRALRHTRCPLHRLEEEKS